MFTMNFTESTTCLVDSEQTCAGLDARDYASGGHYNSCALPMDGDWDSSSFNSSTTTESQNNSSTDSPDHFHFHGHPDDPAHTPSPPQDYSQHTHRHHHNFQQVTAKQQQQQQQHQGSPRWQDLTSCSEEEVTFSDSAISGRFDHHPKLKQHQRQEQQQQQQQQQHNCREQDSGTKGSGSGCRAEREVMFFHSSKGVWDSLAYITNLTDMCDVVFHVGKTRHPVYGIKSLLSVRSRVMYLTILHAQKTVSVSRKNGWKRLRHGMTADDDVNKDGRTHVDVKDYDVNVYSQLIGFLHSGRVTVDVDTVLGLYCAAAEYEVADLRTACWDFVERCVQREQAHSLLMSGRWYLGRKHLDRLNQQFFKS